MSDFVNLKPLQPTIKERLVERKNKDFQDRVVKALRIAQISSIEAINIFYQLFSIQDFL